MSPGSEIHDMQDVCVNRFRFRLNVLCQNGFLISGNVTVQYYVTKIFMIKILCVLKSVADLDLLQKLNVFRNGTQMFRDHFDMKRPFLSHRL